MKNTVSILRSLCLAGGILAVASAFVPSAAAQATASAGSNLSVSTINGESVVTLNGQEIFRGTTSGQVSSRSSNVNGTEYCAVFDGDKLLWENTPGAGQQLQGQGGGAAALDPQQFAAQQKRAFDQMVQAQRQFMQTHGAITSGTNLAMAGGGGGSSSAGSSSSGGGAQAQSGGMAMGGPQGAFPLANGGASAATARRQMGGSGAARVSRQPSAAAQTEAAGITIKTVNGSTVIVYQGQEFSVGPTHGKLSAKTKSADGEDYAAAFEGDRVIWENVPGAAKQVK